MACVCVFQRASDLAEMITRVIREGLEGLVLKDIKVHCMLFVWLEIENVWIQQSSVCVRRGAMNRGSATGWRWKRTTWMKAQWQTLQTWWSWVLSMERAPMVWIRNPPSRVVLCTGDLQEKSLVLTVLAWLHLSAYTETKHWWINHDSFILYCFGFHTGQTSTFYIFPNSNLLVSLLRLPWFGSSNTPKVQQNVIKSLNIDGGKKHKAKYDAAMERLDLL